MRGPSQIANRLRGQFVVRSAGPAGVAAQQFPEYRRAHSVLSANVASCVASNRTATNAPEWIAVSAHALTVTRTAFNAVDFAALRCLSLSEVTSAAQSIGTGSTAPVYVGEATIGAGPAGTGAAPLDLWSGRYSSAKVRVRFSDGTGTGREFVCDAGGGWTLTYCATHVGVDLLLPDASVVAAPNASGTDVPALPADTGTVEDFVFEACMTLTSGAGLNTGQCPTLTVSRQLTATGTGPTSAAIFKIPAGAAVASILTRNANFSAVWPSFTDAAGNVIDVGAYPATNRDGSFYTIPRNARHLQITNLDALGQDVTVVWSLEL